MTDLFVCDALMYKDVREALLGHDYETTDALLKGYARKQTKDLPYPALIEEEGSVVEGVLLRDVHTPDLIVLDKFHADHKRILVRVDAEGKEAFVSTYTPKEHVEVLEQEWNEEALDYAEFYLEHVIPEFFSELSN